MQSRPPMGKSANVAGAEIVYINAAADVGFH